MNWTQIIWDAIQSAYNELTGNKTRTFLSILGVTIGVFCIIAVQSAIGSLNRDIMKSFESFGADVLFVSKMPWANFTPESYKKYSRRPSPNTDDLEYLREHCERLGSSAFRYYHGSETVRWKNQYVQGVFAMGGTNQFFSMNSVPIVEGRTFSQNESDLGSNVLVLGQKIADDLFGGLEPVGRTIKTFGQKFTVIGIAGVAGGAIASAEWDEGMYVPLEFSKKKVNLRRVKNSWSSTYMIKPKEGVTLDELKEEATMRLRLKHRLQPGEEDDFSINSMDAITKIIDNLTTQLNMVGLAIGIFSIFVGMFSLANIMFVSVQERTRQIGIKKAIGAPNAVIFSEFLVEGMFLCLVGGLIAIGLIFILFTIINFFSPVEFVMSWQNISAALLLSTIIGILSSIIPAMRAANLSPVEAMRS